MYVGNKELDTNQMEVVKDNSKHLLVVAGAGSGKTLTILGKIKYLVNEQNIKENEILCISFTNEASNSLKEKIKNDLNLNIEVLTFHKLALKILKNDKYEIALDDTLDFIIDKAFEEITSDSKKVKHNCEYLNKMNCQKYYNSSNNVLLKNDFSSQIDNYINESFQSHQLFNLGNTPRILQKLGLKSIPITMTQKTLKHIINEDIENDHMHGISIENIKRIPESLQKPLKVFYSSSSSKGTSIVVITSLVDKEKRFIIVSILINNKGRIGNTDFLTNSLTSAYGKKNYKDYIEREIKKENLLYDNNVGIIKELAQTRVQSPTSPNSSISNSTTNNSQSQINEVLPINNILAILNIIANIIKPKTNVIYKYFNVKHNCEYLKKEKEIKSFKQLISTFIHLFKANNYNLTEFTKFLKIIKRTINIFSYKKEKLFLIITLNIYLYYSKYLKENHMIDFNDMLIIAKQKVDNSFNVPYKYIIIDEFQDTSIVRFDLIVSILKKTNASLMVVGDDFQSIYKFTGCNLDLFINFNNYFNDAKILKLENTYRNSNELISVAGSFVMQNKKQIKKDLRSYKHLDKPIEIIYFKNKKNDFIKLISKIFEETNKPILVLGRNNSDIYKYINEDFNLNNNNLIYKKNKDIKLTYLTVHKSKGLEEENVIVLNNINDTLGFPSKIIDNKILRLVSPKTDNYPYSEERRLFYVALTRTKNKVYLITEKNNESIFIKELLIYKKYVHIIKHI